MERERKKKSIKFLSSKLTFAKFFESCCQDSMQRKWSVFGGSSQEIIGVRIHKLFYLLNFFNECFMVSSTLILIFRYKMVAYNEYHMNNKPNSVKSWGALDKSYLLFKSNPNHHFMNFFFFYTSLILLALSCLAF